MTASIELIAGLIMFHAEGTLFAIRYDADLLRVATQLNEVSPGALRSLISQHHVVVGRPTLVAVAFNFQHRCGVLSEPFRIVIQRLWSVIGQRPRVVPEEYILQACLDRRLFFSR